MAEVLSREAGRSVPCDADAQRPATRQRLRRRAVVRPMPGGNATTAAITICRCCRTPAPSRPAALPLFLAGDDRLRLIQAPRFRSRRKAAFWRLALASSACEGFAAAFSGPRGRGCSAPRVPAAR